jgi:hypothetical protein
MARLASGFFSLLAVAFVSGLCNGDFIEQVKAQSGSLIEGTTYRSFYLGRLFEGRDLSKIATFTGISAVVTAGNAQNVALYAGIQPGPPAGSINIETAITNSSLLNTGVLFTNLSSTQLETLQVGGSKGIALSGPVGTALRNQALSNNGLDFWLVAPVASTFTAPASSIGTSGTTPNNFAVRLQFTAVPEPTSMALICVAATVGLGAGFRRRLSKRS